MAGLVFRMCSMTGWTLASVRPARMSVLGCPVASARAVAAPRPPAEAPVMRTGVDYV